MTARPASTVLGGARAVLARTGWFGLQFAMRLAGSAGPLGVVFRGVLGAARGAGFVVQPIAGRRWRQPDEWTSFSARPPRTYGKRSVTGRILLVGDNQLQHAFGEPDSTSNLADRWSEPSTRPALCTLFGEVLLDEALERRAPRGRGPASAQSMPVLHTGDATNTSCRAEWRRFAATIEDAVRTGNLGPRRPFAMLPGNHDGFLYGNFAVRPLRALDGGGWVRKLARALLVAQWPEWCDRCAEPLSADPAAGGPMRKSDWVRSYLALLATVLGPGRDTDAERDALLADLRDDRGRWRLYRPPPGADGFLVLALARIDDATPADSFVVQVVRWPAPPVPTGRAWRERAADSAAADPRPPTVLGLLLDTCDYPSRFVAAGTSGGLGRLQLRVARAALRAARDAADARPAWVTFFGHHNLSAVQWPGRVRLGALFASIAADRRRFRVLPLWISAHRHKGGWLQARLGTRPWTTTTVRWLDLNVGSLVDWPLGTRDVALAAQPAGWSEHHVVVRSRHRPLAPEDDAAPDVVERARALALQDVLAQRRNPMRSEVADRLLGIVRDPAADALAAESALQRCAATTLSRLLATRAVRASLGPDDEPERVRALGALRAALRGTRPRATPAVAGFVRLREANHAATSLVRRAAGSARAPTPARRLLRAAIVEAAREDQYRQWMAHPDLLPAIADRWYRRAANLDDDNALLMLFDPADPLRERLRSRRHRPPRGR